MRFSHNKRYGNHAIYVHAILGFIEPKLSAKLFAYHVLSN